MSHNLLTIVKGRFYQIRVEMVNILQIISLNKNLLKACTKHFDANFIFTYKIPLLNMSQSNDNDEECEFGITS